MEQDAFNGMVTLLRQPQLKILSLEAFSGFPLEALLLAPGLETFVLHSCGHSLQDADYDLPAHSSSFVPRLKTLICDRTSLANVVNFCLVQRPSRSCLALISGLQKIDLTVLSGDISTDIYGPLLQQARNLNHFGLTVKGSTLNPPSHITLGGISPLQNLNSSSFSTLAYISLNISTASYPHPQTQRSEFTIRDPFLGICGSPLSNLRALKTFDVDLTVQGDFNFETFDFGSQWGVLSETLAVPTAYPKLRKVVISIGIKAIGARDSHTAINSNNPAENLLSRYFDYVVKPQFRALKVLHRQGVLDFSFLVKVWDGRQFVQVQK